MGREKEKEFIAGFPAASRCRRSGACCSGRTVPLWPRRNWRNGAGALSMIDAAGEIAVKCSILELGLDLKESENRKMKVRRGSAPHE